MDRSLSPRRNWQRSGLIGLGFLLVVGLTVGLIWYTFRNGPAASPATGESGDGGRNAPQALPSPTYFLLPTATLTPIPQPVLPSPTPEPTVIAPTPTPTPYIVAGADGVNVRTGPDTSYERIGYIDPDGQAEYLGTEGNWVQIRYEGAVAWVYSPLVTIFEAQADATPTN